LIDVTGANPERGGDAIESAMDKLDALGIRPLDPVGEKDTMMSIQLVRDAFKERRLIIHPRCKKTIVQLQHFQWEEDYRQRKLQAKKDRVRHYDCHFSDLVRYLLFYGPIYRADCAC
jgi:hypothetical protein